MLNPKQLIEYLNELQQQRERAIATVHAVDGAIQAVQTLLASAAQAEPVQVPVTDVQPVVEE